MFEFILLINGSGNQNILQSNADFQGVHTLTVSITLKKYYCSSIYFTRILLFHLLCFCFWDCGWHFLPLQYQIIGIETKCHGNISQVLQSIIIVLLFFPNDELELARIKIYCLLFEWMTKSILIFFSCYKTAEVFTPRKSGSFWAIIHVFTFLFSSIVCTIQNMLHEKEH